jgi:hypothetical protein
MHLYSTFEQKSYLGADIIEVRFEAVNLLGEVGAVVRAAGLDQFPPHLDDVLHLGLDVGQRVVDALGVVDLALDGGDVEVCQLGERHLARDVLELPVDAVEARLVLDGRLLLEQLELHEELLEALVDEVELVLEAGGGLVLARVAVRVHLLVHLR